MGQAFHGAARAVQTAMLARLSEDDALRRLFRAGAGPSPQRPSLSFDEMRSEARADESGLAEHRLEVFPSGPSRTMPMARRNGVRGWKLPSPSLCA